MVLLIDYWSIRNPLRRLIFYVTFIPAFHWFILHQSEARSTTNTTIEAVLDAVVTEGAYNLPDYVTLNSGYKMPMKGYGTFSWNGKLSDYAKSVYHAMKVGYR